MTQIYVCQSMKVCKYIYIYMPLFIQEQLLQHYALYFSQLASEEKLKWSTDRCKYEIQRTERRRRKKTREIEIFISRFLLPTCLCVLLLLLLLLWYTNTCKKKELIIPFFYFSLVQAMFFLGGGIPWPIRLFFCFGIDGLFSIFELFTVVNNMD